jgi:galactitol-specific phosphotransferase system IIB component
MNSEKIISNSIKAIFKNNNGDLRLNQIAINYLEQASATTKLIILGVILWIA